MHCLRTTLKMIFSIFISLCTLRFQIFTYCPNHTSMEIWFIQRSDHAWITYNWFCAPGSHMYNSTSVIMQLIFIFMYINIKKNVVLCCKFFRLNLWRFFLLFVLLSMFPPDVYTCVVFSVVSRTACGCVYWPIKLDIWRK